MKKNGFLKLLIYIAIFTTYNSIALSISDPSYEFRFLNMGFANFSMLCLFVIEFSYPKTSRYEFLGNMDAFITYLYFISSVFVSVMFLLSNATFKLSLIVNILIIIIYISLITFNSSTDDKIITNEDVERKKK